MDGDGNLRLFAILPGGVTLASHINVNVSPNFVHQYHFIYLNNLHQERVIKTLFHRDF